MTAVPRIRTLLPDGSLPAESQAFVSAQVQQEAGQFVTDAQAAQAAAEAARDAAIDAAPYASGPRNVLSELREEFTADSFTVERSGNLVTVHFVNLTSSVGGTGFALRPAGLPVGFQPRTDHTFVAIAENAAPLRCRARAAGIAIHQTTAGVAYSGSVSYFVDPELPTTLPGTPA